VRSCRCAGRPAITFQVSCLWLMALSSRSQARCLEVTAATSQQLLASAKSGGLPLVLMGASTGPDEVMKGIELGAVDFLEMPISPLKLRNIWQHVVRKVTERPEFVELPAKYAVPALPYLTQTSRCVSKADVLRADDVRAAGGGDQHQTGGVSGQGSPIALCASIFWLVEGTFFR